MGTGEMGNGEVDRHPRDRTGVDVDRTFLLTLCLKMYSLDLEQYQDMVCLGGGFGEGRMPF